MAEKCPICDSLMKLRQGKRGEFWGCKKYPDCKGTRDKIDYPDEKDIKLVKGTPEQEEIWDWLKNGKGNGCINARAGSGKAQPLYSKILTPSGWKTMGELKVGDPVIDPDGGVGHVEAVFPQGIKEVFEVVFSDGSSTQCCKEHLWLTQNCNERSHKKTDSVKSLLKIRETLRVRNGTRNNHYIPMVSPVDFNKNKLSIHPYLMGVLLSNGHFGEHSVGLSTVESEIVTKFNELLPEDCKLMHRDLGDYNIVGSEWHVNRILDAIRKLGLSGKLAADKFVPPEYLYSSKEDRLLLLNGLLDTDAYGCDHVVEYSSASKHLAKAVQELVWSFGGKTEINLKKDPKYTYNNEVRTGQDSHRLCISLPNRIAPFQLTRKLKAYIPRTKYQPYRNIEDIKPIGKTECQCIKVSTKRNLYVTDDYIVTHNTFTIVNSIARLKGVKIGVFSFNNHIIREMNEKLMKEGINWAKGYTYNAFGFRAIKNAQHLQHSELFTDKLSTIINEITPDDTDDSIMVRIAAGKLARLCKCYMEDGKDQEVLIELVEKFNIEVSTDNADDVEKRLDKIFDIVPKALELCLKRKSTLDFDDQVWWPVMMKLPVEQFQMLFVDEAQDTNKMQQELIKMACP